MSSKEQLRKQAFPGKWWGPREDWNYALAYGTQNTVNRLIKQKEEILSSRNTKLTVIERSDRKNAAVTKADF